MTHTSDTTHAVLAELREMADDKVPGARELNGRKALDALPVLLDVVAQAVTKLQYVRRLLDDIETDARLQGVYTSGMGIGLNAVYAKDQIDETLAAIDAALKGAGE